MSVTLCPIALVSSCKKCPIFSACPLKGVIGDYKGEEPPAKGSAESTSKGAKPKR